MKIGTEIMDFLRRQWRAIALVIFLAIVHIAFRYNTEGMQRDINRVTEETEDLKTRSLRQKTLYQTTIRMTTLDEKLRQADDSLGTSSVSISREPIKDIIVYKDTLSQ